MAGCFSGYKADITALTMAAVPKPMYRQITERLERDIRS
jgi:hypothetical protein